MTPPSLIDARAAALREDFDVLEDWEARFAHIIDMGRRLAPLKPDEYADANKVRGCTSQVWLVAGPSGVRPGGLALRGASDAAIVQGLVAILVALYSDQRPDDIAAFDADAFFRDIGLADALTPQRSNGLRSMLARIRSYAEDGPPPAS
jgi:cysteine desulfuration protein SufE